MNSHPSSSNGYPHRRVDKEAGMPMKSQTKMVERWTVDTPSRDSFVYLTTCKIGHHVEVHLKMGLFTIANFMLLMWRIILVRKPFCSSDM
ncbi:unnamed protein product [Eruca vesicaria subsp. sativa]|uniref:Uncharacterized protein n=1 Tax=Eruca vesicaria subsp. sativa TaxID=29727 RepID=A0ABC8LFE4_ERUVS|nr:unnamed protein product [Eruca vesicaria subsp. sativa]